MIFITGDTHCDDTARFKGFLQRNPQIGLNDYLIIAGDFGGVWEERTLDRDLQPFCELPCTVLFIDGNHENFDLLESFPTEEWHGGKVRKIRENIIHLTRGQVFEIDGNTFFTFGGATSIDRFMRTEGLSWWRRELPDYRELDEGIANLKRYNNSVDYVITHSCGERAFNYPQIRFSATLKADCPEMHMLSYFEDVVKFRHWYFGHFHTDAVLSDKYTALFHEIVEIK